VKTLATRPKTKHDEIKLAAEQDLITFIRLVAPHRVLGKIHEEVCRWWCRDDAKSHQMLLLPRDHQKSALVAYRVAWEITRNPAVTIMYISSTANLAEKQLKMVKDILTSRIYRRYWPEMVAEEEGKREKWSVGEIAVDHPVRKKEGVRDPTVFTAGLTTSITGLHCNVAVLDDVVAPENAYTREGRSKVKSQYSLLASIETTDAREWVVGTRYHPGDLYGELQEMQEEHYDETGAMIYQEPVYEVFQREVEDNGDGTGEYLWPRQQRPDGKWFGFNQAILARKRAQYLDTTQFYAQYYNNPNDPGAEDVKRDNFQYYDKRFLSNQQGAWFFRDKPLAVVAAIDFAFSLNARADFTALVVIGVDPDWNVYVLDVERFKTNRIKDYFDRILRMHRKWGFRKIRAEVTVAQDAIVEDLKVSYIRPQGLALTIDKFRPTRNMGSKEERIAAALKPRYENGNMWHYMGGEISELEEELTMKHPKHDDIKDALASAISIAVPAKRVHSAGGSHKVVYHPRFGGVAA
jgi:phage terminase large subunit-like protein